MDHTLQALANLAVAVFVISSMLSMGLSLTMQQILEPLRNGRLVILALVLNFLVVPALAYGLAKTILANQQSLGTGMILLGTAAGAPFLPKLTQVAKGNLAFAVGLMVAPRPAALANRRHGESVTNRHHARCLDVDPTGHRALH